MMETDGRVSPEEAAAAVETEESMEKTEMSDLNETMVSEKMETEQVYSRTGKEKKEEGLLREEGFSREERFPGEERLFREERNSLERGNFLEEADSPMNERAGSQSKEADFNPEENVEPDSLAIIEPLLDKRIVRAVREMGFEKLTPIQVQAIPYLLEGEDIIGQAQTGTGKTAAFAIPALQKIDTELRSLQTIILCPTRELAMQAADEIRSIAKYMHGIKVLPVYGGQEIRKQINGLKGTQIIVGTPGRVMDHMRRHTIKLEHVNMVVLDEADEMLDMDSGRIWN